MGFGWKMLGAIVEGFDGVTCFEGMAEFQETFYEETFLAVAVFAFAEFDEVFDLLVIAALDKRVLHIWVESLLIDGDGVKFEF